MAFPRTLAISTACRGTGTRLIRWALSMIDVVPLAQAWLKKLKGMMPHNTKTGNLEIELGKIFVNTNVNTAIMTSGFTSDQKTPSDMFR